MGKNRQAGRFMRNYFKENNKQCNILFGVSFYRKSTDMQIKKSAVLLLALAVSSMVLLVLSSRAEACSVVWIPKTQVANPEPTSIYPASIFHWELLSTLLVRPVA
jgi:hypothetical protein